MKRIVTILIMVAALTACGNTTTEENRTSSDNTSSAVKERPTHVEHITATVVRVGRYLYRDCDATESGTVLIFDNGQVFKRPDEGGGAFACAVKEGDTITYDRTPDGKITLTGFVVK